ncbi:hypothetical protein [Azotobacter salinestris]|uniref:hypothetical protein n=1 Tax=Azotobacter salinestris TaxID=69964 RepID=UPI00142EBE65|nr:hypothetical protein [Azotobacter salinestris]
MEKINGETGCTVWLNQYQVHFPNQIKAEVFIAQLQARLQAPHHLPAHRATRR